MYWNSDGDEILTERDKYEKNLRKRQEEHLKRVMRDYIPKWKPCKHDSCTECHGTGIKLDGSSCVHMISCDCPRCSPMMFAPFIYEL